MTARRQARKGAGNRAAAYVRISRDCAARGLGVERQLSDCEAVASRLGASIVATYQDNDLTASRNKRTGELAERPAFDRLVADIRAGKVDVILCSFQDRVIREPAELEDMIPLLDALDVPVHPANAAPLDLTNAAGRLMARTVGAFAKYEGEQKAERLTGQKRQARAMGAWTGGKVPFGYRLARTPVGDASLVAEPSEARWVRRMADAIVAGVSLHAIAQELNAEGVPTPEAKRTGGAPWRANQVRSVVVKPLVAGYRTHEGAIVGDALWAPIVPRDVWASAVATLSRPERKRNSSEARWLLTPWVQNEEGSRHATGSGYARGKVGRSGGRTFYMVPGASITADRLDREVWDAILEVTDALGVGAQTVAEGSDELAEDIATLEARRARLGAMFATGDLSDEDYASAAREVKVRLDALRSAQRDAEAGEVAPTVLELMRRPGAVRAAWATGELTFADRRAVIGALVERVIVRDRYTEATDEAGDQARFSIVWR